MGLHYFTAFAKKYQPDPGRICCRVAEDVYFSQP